MVSNIDYIPTPEAAQKIAQGRKYEHKLAIKKRQNTKLSREIREYIGSQGWFLPQNKKELEQWTRATMEAFGEDEGKKIIELNKFQYNLRCGQSLGFAFFGENFEVETVTAVHAYTKNRLCFIWNWAKEQKIRKTYFHYLRENQESLKKYKPMHLTLTLRRDKEGKYKGQKFFGHILLAEFKKLRQLPIWGLAFYGGEYGIETKKGTKTPGLHTHLHSFTLMYKDWNLQSLCNGSRNTKKNLNQLETDLKEIFIKELEKDTGRPSGLPDRSSEDKLSICQSITYILSCIKLNEKNIEKILKFYWEKLTNSTQIHLEQLYIFKRDAKGKKVYEYRLPSHLERASMDIINESELVKVPVKQYVTFEDDIKNITSGVLECIKYHFKNDTFKNPDGSTDIDTMYEVLAATKNKKMYGRYGGLYKIPVLSFNFKNEPEPKMKNLFEEIAPETEEKGEDLTVNETGTKIRDFMKKVYNPFSKKMAYEHEFLMVVFDPATRKHRPTEAIYKPRASITDAYEDLVFIDQNTDFGDLIQRLCSRTEPIRSATNEILRPKLQYIRDFPGKKNVLKRVNYRNFANIEARIKHAFNEARKAVSVSHACVDL